MAPVSRLLGDATGPKGKFVPVREGRENVLSDVLSPAELPLGVVMAIIGAPIFLHMVVRRGMAAS